MKIFFRYGKFSLSLLLALTFFLIFLTHRNILNAGFCERNGLPFSAIPDRISQIYRTMQKWVYLSSAVYLLIVVMTEIMYLIPSAVKLLTFNYTFDNGTLLDSYRYYILSGLTLFNNVTADGYYAGQSLNVLKIACWFIPAFGFSKISSAHFDRALSIISSYVPALVVWIAAVMCFSLMIFPSTG